MTNRRTLIVGGAAVAATVVGGGTWAGFRQMGSMADFRAGIAALRAALPADPAVRDLIRYATLAANSHNTQAWQFRPGKTRVDILPDPARRTPVVDPDDHHLFVSLGCAAENLAVAAAARGRPSQVAFDPTGAGSVSVDLGTGASRNEALCDAIPSRQSTRADFDGTPVSPADLALLGQAGSVPGVEVILLTERARIDKLRDLVLAGNAAQMADPAFMTELKSWMRFSPRRALATGDGLFGAVSGNPVLPEWLAPSLLKVVFAETSEARKYAGQIASSAGIAVFVGAEADPAHWVLVGRACQRFALQATALGLKHAFLNQPVEVPGFRAELAALAGLPGRRPDLVMRFGRGTTLPYAARRPVDSVIV